MNGKIHRLWCLILDSDGISGSFFVGSVNMCFIFADVIIVYRVFNATWVFGPVVIPLPKKPYPSMRV